VILESVLHTGNTTASLHRSLGWRQPEKDEMKRFLEGRRANVKGSPSGRLRFLLNNTRVTMLKSLKRDKKHSAHDQVYVAEGGQRYRHNRAIFSQDYDVAKRLAINIRFHNCAGHEQRVWLTKHSTLCLHQINSTVHGMLGIPNRIITNTSRGECFHHPSRNMRKDVWRYLRNQRWNRLAIRLTSCLCSTA